ncbi:MAG TPA: 50S ribosomal protein L29 [Dehalococcoidales bacterium]|nr:50S ribosomal protein L29 [Dehalococcoidales bacterium]
MKVKEIRSMASDELEKQLQAANQQLFEIKIKLSTKQLVNHREIPRVKKQIAAIKTILRERELESQASGAKEG